ncbi:MAG: GNAT family N-acetyltransferase [Deltaproteobacteria bacterium]|nr:GNAT family N-acetyltransferase [Candidatus Zymogenaceae bacterium]
MNDITDGSKFSIRPADERDVGVLTNIIRRSFAPVAIRFEITRRTCPTHPSFCTDRWIEEDMADGDSYLMLVRDEIPTGCVGVKRGKEAGICYLTRLAVMPNAQHRGGGSALIQQALDEAKQRGAKTAQVGIIADDTRLEAWYRRRGFVVSSHARFMHLPFRVTFLTRNLDSSIIENDSLEF